MILDRWTNDRTGCIYRRITKSNARRMFCDGHTVIIAPVFANMNSPWHLWHIIQYNGKDEGTPEQHFERIINSFIYYNCNAELGRYPKYYIPESIYHRYFG